MKWPDLHNGDRIRIHANSPSDGAYQPGHIGRVQDCEHRNYPIVTFRGNDRLMCAVDPDAIEVVLCPHVEEVAR